MKLIVTIGLLCVLAPDVLSFNTGLALDLEDIVKIEDTTGKIKEGRLKDNDIFKLGDKAVDKLEKSGNFEDELSLKKLDEHETAYKFDDYANDAKKHDLAKASNYDVRLKDEKNIAKANEVQFKKGTNLDKAKKDKVQKGLDSRVHDRAAIGAAHGLEKIRSRDRNFGRENLLSDGFESLFDNGHHFEFGSLYRPYPKRIQPAFTHPVEDIIVHPGHETLVHPGDKIRVRPGDEIIVRTNDDVVISPNDVVEDVGAVGVPTVRDVNLDAFERIGAVAETGPTQGLLRGRLADIFRNRHIKPFGLY